MRRTVAVAATILLIATGAVCGKSREPAGAPPSSQRDISSGGETSSPASDATTPDNQTPAPIGARPQSPSGPQESKGDKGDQDGFDWSKVLIPGLFTLIGSVAVILFQKHSLERNLSARRDALDKTIEAQRENIKATIDAQLKTATEKLEADAKEKREELERTRSSLVTAIATEAIFISTRTGNYAEQVAQYEDVTKGALD